MIQFIKRRKKNALKKWLKDHWRQWKPKGQKTPTAPTKNSA